MHAWTLLYEIPRSTYSNYGLALIGLRAWINNNVLNVYDNYKLAISVGSGIYYNFSTYYKYTGVSRFATTLYIESIDMGDEANSMWAQIKINIASGSISSSYADTITQSAAVLLYLVS